MPKSFAQIVRTSSESELTQADRTTTDESYRGMRTHLDTHHNTEYDIPKTSSSGLHHVGLQCLAASATLLYTQSSKSSKSKR